MMTGFIVDVLTPALTMVAIVIAVVAIVLGCLIPWSRGRRSDDGSDLPTTMGMATGPPIVAFSETFKVKATVAADATRFEDVNADEYRLASAPDANPYGIKGFAAAAGTTYGGYFSGNVIRVTNTDDFLAAAANLPVEGAVVVFENKFCLTSDVNFVRKANLTIDGQGFVLQQLKQLSFKWCRNVVVRNVKVEFRSGDAFSLRGGHHLCFSNVSFYYGAPEFGLFQDRCFRSDEECDPDHGVMGPNPTPGNHACDEGLSLQYEPRFVTVQKCLMYAMWEGFDTKDGDNASISWIENCWWHCRSRAPKVGNKYNHVLNSVYVNDVNDVDGGGVFGAFSYNHNDSLRTARGGPATVVVEGTYVHNVKNFIDDSSDGDEKNPSVYFPGCSEDYILYGPEYASANTDECSSTLEMVRVNQLAAAYVNDGPAWSIPYAYEIYDVTDRETVENVVRGAGAVVDWGDKPGIDIHFGDTLTLDERQGGVGRVYDAYTFPLPRQLNSDWIAACGLAGQAGLCE